MPVPSSIADLSTTPSSNSPAGSETPSSTDDYLRTQFAFIKQLADGNNNWCGTSGGTANAITLAPATLLTAYVAGQSFKFKAASTNTAATTVAISGLSAISVQVNGAACIGGEIVSGQWYEAWLSDASTVQIRACAAPNQVGAINFKRATVAAAATTTPIWATGNGNIQDWTGTPTITDFPAAPQAGSQRQVFPAAGTVITNAGNISVQGGANYTVSSGDKLTITATTTSTFYVEVAAKANGATETVKGIAEVATQAETNAGTDDATIVTPKKLRAGFSISLTAIGHLAFPTWLGGLVINWGSGATSAGADVPINLSFPFPTVHAAAVATIQAGGPGRSMMVSAKNLSTISLSAYNSSGTKEAQNHNFFCVGW